MTRIQQIAHLETVIETLTANRDNAKAEAKKYAEDIEEKMEEVADLAALWKKGRPCFALVDGGITAETPSNLPLWDAVAKSQERAAEQAKVDPVTSPIYLRFGEGKCDALAFARVLYPATCGRAHVQNEGPGSWSAYHNGELVSKGWRSAADAMLSVFAHAKAEGFEEAGWDAVAKIGPVEPTANETKAAEFMPPDAGEAAPSPGRKRKAKDAPAAPKHPAQADDGTIYRAMWKGELVAVAQVHAPGPWFGYLAGVRKVEGMEHSAAAKLAMSEALGATTKDPLVWGSKVPEESGKADEAPKPAPRARRTAAGK